MLRRKLALYTLLYIAGITAGFFMFERDKKSYFINCRSGKLRVLEQQLQGKKRMSAGDFMRGHKLSIGDRFGAEEGE